MNTVPFEKLGPGQSGRLAYQVMGQDGPIFNPQNIRYLSPEAAGMQVGSTAGTAGLQTGLAGANLVCSVLNLAVSAYIARRVNALHKKMDVMQETLDRIESKVDYIVQKVDRIDIQVAENNLRHALEYTLQQAVYGEEVDLTILAGLCGDFRKFKASLPAEWLLLNFGLYLSSDIRDRLRQIYDLAYGLRKVVAQRYNAAVDGDPERIVIVDPPRDYLCCLGPGPHSGLANGTKMAMHLVTSSRVPRKRSEEIQEFLTSDGLSFLYSQRYLPAQPFMIFGNVEEDIAEGLYDLCRAWLYRSDAGLLWRTWSELGAMKDGYHSWCWPQLQEADLCGFDQIDVTCDLALIENA